MKCSIYLLQSAEKKNEQKIKLLEKESERDYLTGLLNYRALSQ